MSQSGAKILRIVHQPDGTQKIMVKCPYCYSSHFHTVDGKHDFYMRDAPCNKAKEYLIVVKEPEPIKP